MTRPAGPPRPSPATDDREDRLAEIVRAVAAQGQMRVHDLAGAFRVSRATLRRDLALLESRGLVRRVHGGVRHVAGPELPVRYRESRHRAAKERIAAAAVEAIPRRPMAVAVSGGTTTTEVARRLVGRTELTVVTNAVNIAVALAEHPGMRIVTAGGTLRRDSYEAVGPMTERFLEGLTFGVTVMGVDGVSAEGGLTTHDTVEARTDQVMAERAQRLVVVADSSKVGHTALARIVPARAGALLVTDTGADPHEVERLRRLGVEVRLV